eukprot:NODE_6180_length_466_cov_68.901679_g4674_i0.p3 GENE.NODE_6180_length_466_cov_68.901679_g4674_i0~~NODE_6180_length_466_cov_68.901679_g4674_i0.p3  ORF type:complete len:71 (-),score=3.11 NODE_6180_length_466_cov_68.901679_g4674_i0:252-464(-)
MNTKRGLETASDGTDGGGSESPKKGEGRQRVKHVERENTPNEKKKKRTKVHVKNRDCPQVGGGQEHVNAQ